MTPRCFNDTGPIEESERYHIPRLRRINLSEVLQHIERNKYFVIYAPPGTGKTTTLNALRDLLNSGAHGSFRSVVVNVESAHEAGGDYDRAIYEVITAIGNSALDSLDDSFVLDQRDSTMKMCDAGFALQVVLSDWCKKDPVPLVLMIDDFDALVGNSLISLFRQLRSGYMSRFESGFPQSVILCGSQDVRDYRMEATNSTSGWTAVTGGVPFNISVDSYRLRDFSKDEVFSLLEQHTEATGQLLNHDAKDYIWEQTQGQPWLVNKLARDTIKNASDVSRAITHDEVVAVREELLIERIGLIDKLVDQIKDPRAQTTAEWSQKEECLYRGTRDDIDYVRAIGLIAWDSPIRFANPIVADVALKSFNT